MKLQEKLDDYKHKFVSSGKVTPEMLGIMEHSTEELRSSGILQRVLTAGQKAPAFELPNQDGQVVSSNALLANGALVISFFRGVW